MLYVRGVSLTSIAGPEDLAGFRVLGFEALDVPFECRAAVHLLRIRRVIRRVLVLHARKIDLRAVDLRAVHLLRLRLREREAVSQFDRGLKQVRNR